MRRHHKRALIHLLGIILFLTLPWAAQGAGAPEATLTVAPEMVHIGSSFTGAQLTVAGEIPTGTQALLEVTGQTTAEELMRKGRRGGLWMNVGEVKVQGAPSIYLVASSASELLAPGAGRPWGYQALEKQVNFSGQVEAAEIPWFFKEFLQLKESQGLYAMLAGALKATAGSERTAVRGTIELPSKIAPGTYQVCLSGVQDGTVVCKKTVPLKVVMVGFPAAVSDLAYQHGALHGILAVLIAIVVGFVMGFVFKGKGGAH